MGRSNGLPKEGVAEYLANACAWPDDAGCSILHVDMDAFYASVEIRSRPELHDQPVVIGGIGARGVVSSANYIARSFGIRAAMPTGRARQLCPRAVFLPPNFVAYRETSQGVMRIFREITPLVEPLSLDEAFLDVSGALRRLRLTPGEIGQEIRRRVSAEHMITCSVGVASTKFVAKLASGMAKPDGMLVVPKSQLLKFVRPLPVSALWGVGQRTAEQLTRAGLLTVADVAATPLLRLRRIVGSAVAEHVHALSQGHDDREVTPDTVEKSVGAEETFNVDQDDRDVVKRELLRLAERTASSLRQRGLRTRTISIKVRYADFTTITRSRTIMVATNVTREIYLTACRLFLEQTPVGAVRLIGVRAEQLLRDSEIAEQLSLDTPIHGWRDADAAADLARLKFGHEAIRPASLLASRPSRAGATEPKPD